MTGRTRACANVSFSLCEKHPCPSQAGLPAQLIVCAGSGLPRANPCPQSYLFIHTLNPIALDSPRPEARIFAFENPPIAPRAQSFFCHPIFLPIERTPAERLTSRKMDEHQQPEPPSNRPKSEMQRKRLFPETHISSNKTPILNSLISVQKFFLFRAVSP
jgi:hypothetical protein